MSRFSEVKQGPPIEVFALNKAYLDDTFDKKVNLGVGGKKWFMWFSSFNIMKNFYSC